MFNLRGILALFRPAPSPFDLALRDLTRGRFARALERLNRLLDDASLTPAGRAAILNKRGVALVRLERRDEARASFESALGVLASYPPALVNLGNLLIDAGDVDGAIRYYESAIRSDESYANAHHHLSVAYRRLGRTADAVRALRRAHHLEGRGRGRQTT
jgi:tetratricopeptide (TPR) repeat protein